MIQPTNVKAVLARHILTEGFDLILDLDRSSGCWMVDARNGDRYLDFFSMYASMAVGFNHPKLLSVQDRLGRIAVNKPANSDVYSEAMADFVETFGRIAKPSCLPHAFFVEGGAVAVENALKAAFDWKVQRNLEQGRPFGRGDRVIHFRQAFHGRTGYALSLTNTFDPRKTRYFPRFDWPRIVNPKMTFPLNDENLTRVKALEQEALQQIRTVIEEGGDDIAALIIEPIQGEGGDNHFRAEFFRALREICDEHEILFILDEVQSGVGITGRFWAYEHFDIEPDVISFGKKTQVCGILASRRIDDNPCNVFSERSRINSTFGGNLLDMVRCRYILEIIEEDRLVENARRQGALLLDELNRVVGEFPGVVSNARGRGLMCAFDLPDSGTRDQFIRGLLRERLVVVGSGERTVRFRPHLIVTADEIHLAVDTIRRVLREGRYRSVPILHEPCLGIGT